MKLDIEDLKRLSGQWRIDAAAMRESCRRIYALGIDGCADDLDALIAKVQADDVPEK